MKPFFSVIIPTLNEEKFLPRLLNDLVKQKEKNFEVIIADGCSTDRTKVIAESYRDRLNIIFYCSERKNVASQRNFGSEKAQGQYLVFIDADARIKYYFFKRLLKNLLKTRGLLYIPFLTPEKGDEEYKPVFDLLNIFVELSLTLKKRFSLGGSIIIEKYFFNLIGKFDEKLFVSEDHELIQRAYEWGVNCRYLHDTKISFSLRRMKKEGQIKMFYKYLLSTAHRLFLGEIKNKIFDYQMGGQVYTKDKLENNKFDINKYIFQIKKLLKKVIKELELNK